MKTDKVEKLVEEIRELVNIAYRNVDPEYAAELFLENPRKARIFWLKYHPTRKAAAGRIKPITTIGIASLMCIEKYCWHNIFIDIDKKSIKSATTAAKILEKHNIPTLIYETKKGYHIYGLKPMSFKEVLHILTKAKPYVDRKWLSLQRKRKLIIIRVAGKYRKPDIKLVKSKLCSTDSKLIKKYAASITIFLEISRTTIWNMIKEGKL